MGVISKKTGIIFIVTFVVALLVLFGLKYYAESKVDTFVDNLPKQIDLQYDDVDVNILFGNLTIKKPLLTIKGEVTNEVLAQINLETFEVNDLGYWDYLTNDAINLESVKISQPKITYYHNKNVEKQSYGDMFKGNSKKSFSINDVVMSNADIEVFDIETDSMLFSSESLNLQLASVASNTSKVSRLPFSVGDFSLTSKDLKYQVSDFENLTIQSMSIDSKSSKFSSLKLKTKYSERELSNIIKTERDHYDLSIASIDILNQELSLEKDSTTVFKASKMILNTPEIDIYRDKLVADDLTHKPLYSKMLRDLNFSLDLNTIIINNGQIIYEEKVKEENQAGKLEFSNLEATINNVSNLETSKKPLAIDIKSTFMKNTPLNVEWNFDVSDVNDGFIFKADIGLLKAEHLNQFMQPNLNFKLEGELIQTYFTIDGNANTSIVDLKTKYEQFDVVILQDDGKEKNKFLSGLVNLFISKDSKNSTDDFRASDTKTVDRDKTKSIFNFVWKNAQSGLLSAMAGDGEKDD